MKRSDTAMAKNVTVLARVSPELKARLQALARNVDRSESYVVAEAISEYVEANAWQIAEIRRRLDSAKAGEPGVPHDEVDAWVRSWGSKKELPKPKPRPKR